MSNLLFKSYIGHILCRLPITQRKHVKMTLSISHTTIKLALIQMTSQQSSREWADFRFPGGNPIVSVTLKMKRLLPVWILKLQQPSKLCFIFLFTYQEKFLVKVFNGMVSLVFLLVSNKTKTVINHDAGFFRWLLFLLRFTDITDFFYIILLVIKEIIYYRFLIFTIYVL